MNFPILKIVAAGSVVLAVAGCLAPNPGGPATGRYSVTAERTPFYEKGPAQAYGPDFTLNKGQEVEVIDRGYGFSRVKTDADRVGYVANEDIAPVPGGAATASDSRPTPGRRDQPSAPVDDQPADIPLPQSQAAPVTDFRY